MYDTGSHLKEERHSHDNHLTVSDPVRVVGHALVVLLLRGPQVTGHAGLLHRAANPETELN